MKSSLCWFGFLLTYLGLALGEFPGLRMDRTGIAVVGATWMLVTGVLSLHEAARAVDYETILLLFGMMVVVGFLRYSGFFKLLAEGTLRRLHSAHAMLAMIVAMSGVLSAFLVNDVVCLALAPLVLHLARRSGVDPVPQLIGLATASNIGSTATITGNPQNMIIGSLSQISYLRFAERLAPIALVGLVLNYLVIAWIYRRALAAVPRVPAEEHAEPARDLALGAQRQRKHRALLVTSVLVSLAAIGLFFAGYSPPLVALGAGAILLVSRIRPDKIYRQIDWGLLVMFCGLFVVVRAFEVSILHAWNLQSWTPLVEHPVGVLSLVSAGLSNLVSNVPAVLLFKPIVAAMAESQRETAWLALAMSSTLAGNLTVLGSVANLIVVQCARREGVVVSFWDYLRVGLPITVITLAIGMAWLAWT